MTLYPLKFKSRLVEKMWGGRRMEPALGKALPGGKLIGESWELYDFPPGAVEESEEWVSAVIANGPLTGRTLHWAISEFGEDVLGDVQAVGPRGQFPILVKFLDARETLSLQVHPDEAYAAAHPECAIKTEAWYVLESAENGTVWRGLKAGTTRQGFEAALAAGRVMDCINSFAAKAGQCYFLPSGTVHALGAGLLVAEVQTPSDVTFRIADFGRTDPSTGKPRKLHPAEALECIDFSGRIEPMQKRAHVAGLFTTVTRLVNCPAFKLEKVRFTEGVEEIVPYDEPVVWIMLEGAAELTVEGVKEPTRLGRGDTVLLPARMKKPTIKTVADCVWLEVTFPTKPEVG
jgi:mannose-6-phosphate isomerase